MSRQHVGLADELDRKVAHVDMGDGSYGVPTKGRVLLVDASNNPIVYDDNGTSLIPTYAKLAPGATVNIGTGVPEDPGNMVLDYCKNGNDYCLRKDGSSTPINYDFSGVDGETLAVKEVKVVFSADDFEFDGVSFGPNTALVNGVLFQTIVDSVTTDVFTLKVNEDFMRVPGPPPTVNNTGPKDLLSASFSYGGLLKLNSAADKIRVIVRDNLTSVKLKYLTATVHAVKV